MLDVIEILALFKLYNMANIVDIKFSRIWKTSNVDVYLINMKETINKIEKKYVELSKKVIVYNILIFFFFSLNYNKLKQIILNKKKITFVLRIFLGGDNKDLELKMLEEQSNLKMKSRYLSQKWGILKIRCTRKSIIRKI